MSPAHSSLLRLAGSVVLTPKLEDTMKRLDEIKFLISEFVSSALSLKWIPKLEPRCLFRRLSGF